MLGCGQERALLELQLPEWQVSGGVTYNGRTFAEFIPERTSVYVEQEDKHMPELSVRETLNFAALCHGTGGRRGKLPALAEQLTLRPWQVP